MTDCIEQIQSKLPAELIADILTIASLDSLPFLRLLKDTPWLRNLVGLRLWYRRYTFPDRLDQLKAFRDAALSQDEEGTHGLLPFPFRIDWVHAARYLGDITTLDTDSSVCPSLSLISDILNKCSSLTDLTISFTVFQRLLMDSSDVADGILTRISHLTVADWLEGADYTSLKQCRSLTHLAIGPCHLTWSHNMEELLDLPNLKMLVIIFSSGIHDGTLTPDISLLHLLRDRRICVVSGQYQMGLDWRSANELWDCAQEVTKAYARQLASSVMYVLVAHTSAGP